LRHYGAKARKLLQAVARLPRSRPFSIEQPEALDDYDAIVVGSDEVWNLSHPWYGDRPAFFGEGLGARQLASYAASFGNHDAARGIGPEWSKRLGRFNAISVRDRNSQDIVRGALGCNPDIVLDPCLQFPPVLPRAEPRRPYVAVYGHSFPDWYASAVRDYAAAAGYPLRSIGYRNDWADEQWMDASPSEFARAIGGAVAVATNFFHGCVFALLARRPFACVASAYRSNKLRDLTGLLGCEERLVTPRGAVARIGRLLSVPPSPGVESALSQLREKSDRYLARALG
jgi:hypothetical protein